MKAALHSHDHEPEVVVYLTHHHAVVHLAGWSLLAAGAVSSTVWAWQGLTGRELEAALAMTGAIAFGFVGLVSLVRSLWRHRAAILVTNQAVIRRRTRVLWRVEETIILDAIEHCEVRQSLLGWMLNYGTVQIDYGERSAVWRDVINPHKLVREIKAHREHEHDQPHLVGC